MRIAIVGLGRMGADMTRRLLRGGHAVVVTDLDEGRVRELQEEGAIGARDVAEALTAFEAGPRALWSMVPAGQATEDVVTRALAGLAPGDLLVDGANSHWQDSVRRAERAVAAGVAWLDAGVSGGIWGLEEGYNLMVGGDATAFERLRPVLESLAPPGGVRYVGPAGSGHFVKMIHNAIEYGVLQAYAEGFQALAAYPHAQLDLPAIADLWDHGSVIRSWLLSLLAAALRDDPTLAGVPAYVEDSGMGRWAVRFGIDHAVPMPATAAALFARFASRLDDDLAAKVVAILRREFGGHVAREPG